jgi:hypothetical protein
MNVCLLLLRTPQPAVQLTAKFRHCSAELEYPLVPRQRHSVAAHHQQ